VEERALDVFLALCSGIIASALELLGWFRVQGLGFQA
jgi:hypothetical protein